MQTLSEHNNNQLSFLRKFEDKLTRKNPEDNDFFFCILMPTLGEQKEIKCKLKNSTQFLLKF